MQHSCFLDLGPILRYLIHWYVCVWLRNDDVGNSLPTISQLLFPTQTNVSYEDTIARMLCTTVPHSVIKVLLVLGSTSLCCFLSLLVSKVQSFPQLLDIVCLTGRRQSIKGQSQEPVYSKSRVSAIHQEVRGITRRVMEGSIVRMHQGWYMCVPIALLVILEGFPTSSGASG